MRNTFILSHFLDFLNEQELFTAYLKNATASGERSFFLLESLFFTCQPDRWIRGAFFWDNDPSHDWAAIDKIWLIRLNTLRKINYFND